MTEKERIKHTLGILNERHGMYGYWYGMCTAQKLSRWNYFVYNKKKTRKASNGCDIQNEYEIHIVHEDEVPEDLLRDVIREIEEGTINGVKLKLTEDQITYDYSTKGNTDMVVEIATISVVRPQKR